jgi:hypothetical protein
LIHLDQLFDHLDQLHLRECSMTTMDGRSGRPQAEHLVKSRKEHSTGAISESFHIHVRAEQARIAVLVSVRLHALEALERIVEHAAGGVHGQVAELLDDGRLPAGLLGPAVEQHVVLMQRVTASWGWVEGGGGQQGLGGCRRT